MKTRVFESTLWLPKGVQEVFDFFGNAANLQAITPQWLNFEILTPQPMKMQQGALIDYRLRIRGFPVRWQTEITAWDPPFRFVDEQRRGPYRVWVHEHRFVERHGGTDVLDRVQYASPFGWFVDPLFVSRDVASIFAYRRQKLREKFTPCPNLPA